MNNLLFLNNSLTSHLQDYENNLSGWACLEQQLAWRSEVEKTNAVQKQLIHQKKFITINKLDSNVEYWLCEGGGSF